MATEQTIGVFQIIQTFGGCLVACVGNETIRLQQSGGAHEFIRIPPERGAGRGAATAQNAFIQPVQMVALGGRLQTLGFGRRFVVDQVRLNRMVLLEKLRHVHDQIAYHRQAGQGAQFHRFFQRG